MNAPVSLPSLLIVGAGPVGLTMACELARHGVPCRIIDQAPERSQTSKALGIFPRTLEVFETMGLAEQAIAAGQILFGLHLRQGEKEMAHIDFSSVASPYPFLLSLPQSETERLLIARLAELGVQVERNLALTGLAQTDTVVQATVRHADGRAEIIETPWLLGCDGAHSATRHALGMEFEGAPYDESFVLADVRLESTLSPHEAHLFFSGDGLLALFPFGGDRVRVIANIPAESRRQDLPEATLAEIQQYADRRGIGGMKISDAVWISRFHISHRKVAHFRKIRVFLAGDAAHIHSPAGGQGMNTGIQDAFNLAWKLALVVKGRAPAALLGSYDLEREPIAKGVLNLTDRITRLATVTNPVAKSVRNFVLSTFSGIDLVSENIADRMAELLVNYRQSPIVQNDGGGAVRAGDRAPDGELRDANGQACRVFELFRDPRHTLLVFLGNGAYHSLADAINAAVCGEHATDIALHRIERGRHAHLPDALRDISGAVHTTYDLLGGGVVLIRPDGYIGYRSPGFSTEKLQRALSKNFAATPSPETDKP
ncbi:MAG TPA: FAD-dependent monooxygenase [Chthoniobacterales bacterium]|nr:FAD-dependent monooxygenase [Chthoniobacterales bacterium]